LLAALLSLGSLQAARPTRVAPFAQIRPAVSCVLQERRAEYAAMARTLPPAFPAPADVALPVARVRFFNPAFVARLRFQLPPPVSGV
jgi:hypothetical protein